MTETKKELIYEKILAIMKDVKFIGKQRKNVAQGYNFRGVDDIYNELHDIFVKHRVFTVPTVLDTHHEERTSKKGSALIYRIYTIKYTFYAEDGSSVDAIIVGEGMDTGDKAGNKALSVAHKYVLLQMLLIPTDESKDPEDENHQLNKPEPKPEPEPEDDGIAGMASQGPTDSSFRTIPITIGTKTIKHTKYEALDRFGKAKEQLGKELYYKILGEHGYAKANEIPNKDIPKLYDAMIDAFKQGKQVGKVNSEEKPTQAQLIELSKLETILTDKHNFSPNQILNQFKETVGEGIISNMTKAQVATMIDFFKGCIADLNKDAEK